MAVRFDASTDFLKRTTGHPSMTVFTVCCWVRVRSSIASWSPIWSLWADSTNNMMLYAKGNSYFSVIDKYDEFPTAINLTAETWYHIAWPRPGNAQSTTYYYRTAGATSYSTRNYTSETPTNTSITQHQTGGVDDYDEYLNGEVAALKIYSGVALSLAQIWNESQYYIPVRTSNLFIWSPFVEKDETTFRDYSGNGRNWTEGGTVTYVDGPPIPWRPVKRKLFIPTAAEPGGLSMPVAMHHYKQLRAG